MKIVEKNYNNEKNKTNLKTEVREKSPSRSPTKCKTTDFSDRKNNLKRTNRKIISLNNSLSTIHPTMSDQKMSTTLNNLDHIEKELINKIEKEFNEYNESASIKFELVSKQKIINEKKFKTLQNLQTEKDNILSDLNKIKRVENVLNKYDQDNPVLKEKVINAQARIAFIIKDKLEKLNKISEDNLIQIKEEEQVIKNEIVNIDDKLIDLRSKIISNFSSKHWNDLQKELDEKKIQFSDLELKYQKLASQEKENEDRIEQLRIDLIIKETSVRKLEKELKEKILEYEDKAFQIEFELCKKIKESRSSGKIQTTFYTPVKPYIDIMDNIIEEGEEAVTKRKMRKNQSTGNVKTQNRIGNINIIKESKMKSDSNTKPTGLNKSPKNVNNSVAYKLKK